MPQNLETLQARIGRLERKLGLSYGDTGTLEPQSTISAWNNTLPPGAGADSSARTFIGTGRALLEGTGITITKIANSPFLQISGTSDACLSTYIVDPGGAGSHTTIKGAIDAAILTGLNSSIWICGNITEGTIDIGGMGSSQHIYISATDRNIVTITSPISQDIFTQTSGSGAGLHFRNIGFSIPSSDRAIYDVNVVSEVDEIEFASCKFSGGYLLRQDVQSLGGINLIVNDCSGSNKGFYKTVGLSGTLGPDQLNATDNFLTMTEWWNNNPNGLAAPDTTRINGGRYTIATGLKWGNGSSQQHFMNIFLSFSGSGNAFSTSSGTMQIDNLSFSNIIFVALNAGGTFADFQSFNINPNTGLFIKVIDAFSTVTLTTGTTFITVGSPGWSTVLVANIQASGWTTTFEGPGGIGDDHGLLSGVLDDDHTIYALLLGRGSGQTLFGGTAASATLTLSGSSDTGNPGLVHVDTGGLDVGVSETKQGLIRIFGNPSGFEGGEIQLHLSASHSGVFNAWVMDTNADDFRFFTSNGVTVNRFTAEGRLDLNRRGSESGLFLGGFVRLFASSSITDQLVLGVGDSFKIDSGFIDIDEIAAPANPGSAVRRLFTDAATNELSVRTSSGATKSLEKMKWVTTISFGWDAQTTVVFTPT